MSERAQKTAGKHAGFPLSSCAIVSKRHATAPRLEVGYFTLRHPPLNSDNCRSVVTLLPRSLQVNRRLNERGLLRPERNSLCSVTSRTCAALRPPLFCHLASPRATLAATIVSAKGYASVYLLLDNFLCKPSVRDCVGYDLVSSAALNSACYHYS